MNWIIMDLLAAAGMALSVCLAKKGGKDTDATLAATIFCSAVCSMELFIGRKTFSLDAVAQIKQDHWLDILIVGFFLGLAWLFLFMALKTGDATRVLSMAKLHLILIPVISILVNKQKFPVPVVVAMALFLAGIVFMLIGSESAEWLFNALMAACLYTSCYSVESNVIDRGPLHICISHMISLFIFLMISLVKKNGDTFKSLTFAHGMLILFAGFAFKGSTIAYDRAMELLGSRSHTAAVRLNRLDILFAMGICMLLFKEKPSPKLIGGVVTIVAALEVLTFLYRM